jgi:hypothetical protein
MRCARVCRTRASVVNRAPLESHPIRRWRLRGNAAAGPRPSALRASQSEARVRGAVAGGTFGSRFSATALEPPARTGYAALSPDPVPASAGLEIEEPEPRGYSGEGAGKARAWSPSAPFRRERSGNRRRVKASVSEARVAFLPGPTGNRWQAAWQGEQLSVGASDVEYLRRGRSRRRSRNGRARRERRALRREGQSDRSLPREKRARRP